MVKNVKNFLKLEEDLKILFIDRLKTFLIDEGFSLDKITAILSQKNIDQKTILEIKNNFRIVGEILSCKSGKEFISNFKRIHNITNKTNLNFLSTRIKEDLIGLKEEKQMYKFLKKLNSKTHNSKNLYLTKNYLNVLCEFNVLTENFFNNVLVNDEDKSLKNNRINLLFQIKNKLNTICNFEVIKN